MSYYKDANNDNNIPEDDDEDEDNISDTFEEDKQTPVKKRGRKPDGQLLGLQHPYTKLIKYDHPLTELRKHADKNRRKELMIIKRRKSGVNTKAYHKLKEEDDPVQFARDLAAKHSQPIGPVPDSIVEFCRKITQLKACYSTKVHNFIACHCITSIPSQKSQSSYNHANVEELESTCENEDSKDTQEEDDSTFQNRPKPETVIAHSDRNFVGGSSGPILEFEPKKYLECENDLEEGKQNYTATDKIHNPEVRMDAERAAKYLYEYVTKYKEERKNQFFDIVVKSKLHIERIERSGKKPQIDPSAPSTIGTRRRQFCLPIGTDNKNMYICTTSLCNLLNIGEVEWTSVRKHVEEGHTSPKIHPSTGKKNLKNSMPREVLHSLLGHVEDIVKVHAIKTLPPIKTVPTAIVPHPEGGPPVEIDQNLVFLPVRFSKRTLYKSWCFKRGWDVKADRYGKYPKVSDYPKRQVTQAPILGRNSHNEPWVDPNLQWTETSVALPVCSWSSFCLVWREYFSHVRTCHPQGQLPSAESLAPPPPTTHEPSPPPLEEIADASIDEESEDSYSPSPRGIKRKTDKSGKVEEDEVDLDLSTKRILHTIADSALLQELKRRCRKDEELQQLILTELISSDRILKDEINVRYQKQKWI